MVSRSNTRPQDLTGATKERLEAETAAKREAAAEHLATMATVKKDNEGVVEWEDTKTEEAPAEDENNGVSVSRQVEVKEEITSFKVRETLEQVTIGAGNHYTFEEGKTYKYPKYIYDHLEEKGMIWH